MSGEVERLRLRRRLAGKGDRDADDVSALLDAYGEAVAAVTRNQWASDGAYCPDCGAWRNLPPHREDCKISCGRKLPVWQT